MDKQGPRSSAKGKAEIDTFQNMKTEATKAATQTGLLRTKTPFTNTDRIVSGMNIMKLSEAFFTSIISLTVSNKTVETDKIWRGNNRLIGYTFLQISLFMLN